MAPKKGISLTEITESQRNIFSFSFERERKGKFLTLHVRFQFLWSMICLVVITIFPMMRYCLIFPLKNQTKIMTLCVLCGLERKRARGIKSLTYPQSKAWTISWAEGLRTQLIGPKIKKGNLYLYERSNHKSIETGTTTPPPMVEKVDGCHTPVCFAGIDHVGYIRHCSGHHHR